MMSLTRYSGRTARCTKAAPVRLRLVEAAENLAETGIIYTGPKTPAGPPANYYDIVILRETGQARVERL